MFSGVFLGDFPSLFAHVFKIRLEMHSPAISFSSSSSFVLKCLPAVPQISFAKMSFTNVRIPCVLTHRLLLTCHCTFPTQSLPPLPNLLSFLN